MIYLYDALLLILFLPALFLIALRYRKRLASEFLFKAGERFGSWDMPGRKSPEKPLIWVHCASLGEVKAVEPVLRKLNGFSILMTTVTLSGRRYALDSGIAESVFFVPFDFSFIVERAFRKTGASALMLVETELWPGLIHAAGESGAKVFLVNARLSARSYPRYKLLRAFWKPVIGGIDCLCARSREDADRFKGLGFPASKIIMTGNIKYDASVDRPRITRQDLGFGEEDVILVCGSTRKGENAVLIRTWVELVKSMPQLKLVIAPRHLGRTKEITDILKRFGREFAQRSVSPVPAGGCLVLDTFGDLWKYYSVCDIAFVGGSLVDKGGQNPIEPAAFSKPVLFGRHMENFKAESISLITNGGGFEVGGPKELEEKIANLARYPKMRFEAGRKAFNAVQEQKGAVKKTVDIINRIMAANK